MSTFSTRARHASCRVDTFAVGESTSHYLSGRFSVLKMPGVELEYKHSIAGRYVQTLEN